MKPCTEQYKTLKIERHRNVHRLLFGTMHIRVEGNRPQSLLKLGVLLCVSEARTQQHALWQCVGIHVYMGSFPLRVNDETNMLSLRNMKIHALMRISSDKVSKNHIRGLEKTIGDIINNTNDNEEIT